MKRPTGVTVSAVLAFIGSGFTVVFAGLVGFVLLLVSGAPPQPPLIRYFLALIIVLYGAFGVWGIVSGVGLLRLRQWARISMLVFSGILLFFTVPGLLMVPFLPMPPNSPRHIVLAMKIGMSAIYGALVIIGVGWLYYFNQKSVKEQFREHTAPSIVFTPAPEMRPFAQAVSAIPKEKPSRRPLSITIIGWLLIASSWVTLPGVFLHYPMFLFGVPIAGWRAIVSLLALIAANAAAGIGLLRLRPWGRTLAIFMLSFNLLNTVAMVLLPGAATRFEQINASAQANMRMQMGLPTTGVPGFPPEIMHSFMLIGAIVGLIFGMVFGALQLWFVVSRKKAFLPEDETLPMSPAVSP